MKKYFQKSKFMMICDLDSHLRSDNGLGWMCKIMDWCTKIQKCTKNFEHAQLCTTITPWSDGVR